MQIYQITWQEIDWGTYHSVGYNYVKNSGRFYALTPQVAKENCPITEKQGTIDIKPI